MRLTLIALPATLLLGLAAAQAQPAAGTDPAAPPPGTPAAPAGMTATQAAPTPRPRGVTREQFIERVTTNAGKRFDEMDTNHDGVLEPRERQAWAAAHRRGGAANAPADTAADNDSAPITIHDGTTPGR